MSIVQHGCDRDTHTTEVGNWPPHYRQGEAFDFLQLLKSVYSYSAVALGPSAAAWQGDLLCGLAQAVFLWTTRGSPCVAKACFPLCPRLKT